MELSKEDVERCQDLTKQLLEISLHDCEELGLDKMHDANQACLDKKRWKKLQSNADATIYADRDVDSAWLPIMRRQDWEHPVAVMVVGRMDCTLDEVLLAMMTPDAATLRLRFFLMDERPRQIGQIVQIVGPTQQAPFQVVGVTRFVNPRTWPFTMFKSPSEMVLAFATGDITTENGKRYAYEMAQSVDLRCKGARNNVILRTRVVQARIFWEQRDGSIAVYRKLITDVKNDLSDSRLICRGVMGFWKFVPRSLETKKLWWCVKNKKRLLTEFRSHSQPQCSEDVADCKVTWQGKQTTVNRCEFCERQMCGGPKYRISHQLEMVISNETGILEQTLTLCPSCVVFVRNVNVADIARAQLE